MSETETDGEQWENFKHHVKKAWNEVQDRDLDGFRQSMEELIREIQQATGETREAVRRKVRDLADRYNVPFSS